MKRQEPIRSMNGFHVVLAARSQTSYQACRPKPRICSRPFFYLTIPFRRVHCHQITRACYFTLDTFTMKMDSRMTTTLQVFFPLLRLLSGFWGRCCFNLLKASGNVKPYHSASSVGIMFILNHHSPPSCLVEDLVDPLHEVVDLETAEEAQVDL
jgi:hypothetical protein